MTAFVGKYDVGQSTVMDALEAAIASTSICAEQLAVTDFVSTLGPPMHMPYVSVEAVERTVLEAELWVQTHHLD